MKIKMLENRRGSEDGFSVKPYEKGETYDIADTLARDFIRNGWAHKAETCEVKPADSVEALYSSLNDTMQRFDTVFNRIFYPHPTRGTAPQNPATLSDIGE